MAMQRGYTENLSILHGAFYVATGLWPVLHRDSFEAVTGPKEDFWLVRTTGLLLATAGAVLAVAGLNRRVTPEIKLLGTGVPGALFAVDVTYASKGHIPKIYLLDAFVQAGLMIAWSAATPRAFRPEP